MIFLHFPTFLISLTIGLFLVYIYLPSQQVIYVYPTPENINKIQYQDKADNCYGFSYKQVSCPSNRKEIREYKYQ
tara:strand:- start:4541 stop:4765 length:225 start_codon:yes stop_codon:yes gene_type:complete